MAIQDIFNRDLNEFGGAFIADKAGLTFTLTNAGSGGGSTVIDPMIVGLQVQVQYNQRVSRLYELHACQKVYYVVGRREGQLSLGRAIGPAVLAKSFYEAAADPCNANQNAISICVKGACTPTGSTPTAEYKVHNVLLQGIGMQVNSDTVIITENISFIFTGLEYNVGVDCGTCQ